MQKVKIGFIGAGNMAQAIIHGMLKSGKYLPEQINLYDVDQKKCEKLAEQGMQAAGSSQEVVKQSRSEERRVGKECNQVCRSRWSPYH